MARNKILERQRYLDKKPLYIARGKESVRKRKAMFRAFVDEYKRAHPCVDCGEADPIVLDFDHREPSTKRFGISNARHHVYTLRTLKVEIEKCDLRCANCHRRRTKRQGIAGEIPTGARFRIETGQVELFRIAG